MAQAQPAEDSIRVVCRFRPLNSSELKIGSKYVPKFSGENCVSVGGKAYIFDRVFNSDTTQIQFYEGAAKSIVKDVLCGYNGTIFAYGQTSSGKTHSMEGVIGDSNLQGIIPRIVQDIFNHIYAGDENLVFQIKCSYFEIYLDKITDLLDVTKVNLSVHEDKNRIPFVKGATERFVSSPEEVFAVFSEGKSNRHITATNMNAESSRSHSIFLIDINQEHAEQQKKLSGKLYLVDLAGSEKISKTGAEGMVLDEAKNINKSLSALGNVISSLAEGVKSHIPYRDSKLTRILQESLGGNARTTILICCSPASFNEAETKSTLDFGKRAKTIKNAVKVNEELTAEEWKRRYNKEKEKVAILRGKVKRAEAELEKWRQGETVSAEEQVALDDESIVPVTEAPTETTLPSHFSTLTTNVNTTAVPTAMNSAERLQMEQEQERLYQELDEKDEEITKQCQLVEQLKEQLSDQDNLIAASRKEYERLQKAMTKIQTESEAANDEVQEVLQALEELALNYDQKVTEVDEKVRDVNKITIELAEKQAQLNISASEIQHLREQAKRSNEILANLVHDVIEIERAAGVTPADENFKGGQSIEDDFASARLLVARTKSEINNLVQKCQNLESAHSDCNKKMDDYEKMLEDCRSKLGETKARVVVVEETEKDLEVRKRTLEEQVDELTKECSRLLVQRQSLHLGLSGGVDQSVKESTEKNLELHQKQIRSLRDEIETKQTLVDQLRDQNEQLITKQQYLQEDLGRLKEDGSYKCKFQETVVDQNQKSEQIRNGTTVLQENVSKELQNLLNLRKMFVSTLKTKIRIGDMNLEGSDDFGGALAQKQKIKLLEENLDQLTTVHKLLVKDNGDLRCAILKVEKRLQVTRERVKTLEVALREAREKVMRDRKWYYNEVNRMKEEAVLRKWKHVTAVRRNSVAQIVKPIRAGQPQHHSAGN